MSMNLPPDRSHIRTETRNPRTMDLHTLSAAECVDRITLEDIAAFEAVRGARHPIASFVEAADWACWTHPKRHPHFMWTADAWWASSQAATAR